MQSLPSSSKRSSRSDGNSEDGGSQLDLFEEDELQGDNGQKRNKHRRTRDGCLTCRKGKKACDKHKPTCERCRRLNYECTWPPIRPAPYGVRKATDAQPAASSASTISSAELVPHQSMSSTTRSSADPDYLAGPPNNVANNIYLPKVVSPPLPTPPKSSASPAFNGFNPAGSSGHTYASSSLSSSSFASPATQMYGGGIVDGTIQSKNQMNGTIDPLSTIFDSHSNDAVPSTAMNSNFWQDHSLYTLNYNFSDLSDIDSLLRFTGLMPENNNNNVNTSGATPSNFNVVDAPVAAALPHTDANVASSQLVFPKDKIKEFSSKFSPRLSTLLNKMMKEQDNGTEVKLPLAYVVTTCLWAPSSALEGLLKAAKNVYGGQMDDVLRDLGDVAWAYLTSEPAKATKIAFPPETIANLDISLSQKCFALIDISFREVRMNSAMIAVGII